MDAANRGYSGDLQELARDIAAKYEGQVPALKGFLQHLKKENFIGNVAPEPRQTGGKNAAVQFGVDQFPRLADCRADQCFVCHHDVATFADEIEVPDIGRLLAEEFACRDNGLARPDQRHPVSFRQREVGREMLLAPASGYLLDMGALRIALGKFA